MQMILHVPTRHKEHLRHRTRQLTDVTFNSSFAIKVFYGCYAAVTHFRDAGEGRPDEECYVCGDGGVGDGFSLGNFDGCGGVFPDFGGMLMRYLGTGGIGNAE